MKNPRFWVLLIGCMSSILGAASARAQTPLTPLHTFTSTPNSLIQHPDGNFYGTSGAVTGSMFFRMTPDGTFTPVRTFTGLEAGAQLVLGADGNFYGVKLPEMGFHTWSASGLRVTTSGELSNVGTFSGYQQFRLQGSDGQIYGQGIDFDCGLFRCSNITDTFRMTASGRVKNLRAHFNGVPGSAVPTVTIDAEGIDGSFYGTDYLGDPFVNNNFIYRVAPTPSRTHTTVYTFTNGDDGKWGFVQLQGADGNLYGTTPNGGTARIGSIFRLTPGGTFTVLHSFLGGVDGAAPGKLIEATDGNFYGITTQGGPANLGMVFKLTPTGDFSVVHAFEASEGSPQSVLQGIDGSV
jgi:uncharacterized repeat protein (TIGR03803 family)